MENEYERLVGELLEETQRAEQMIRDGQQRKEEAETHLVKVLAEKKDYHMLQPRMSRIRFHLARGGF